MNADKLAYVGATWVLRRRKKWLRRNYLKAKKIATVRNASEAVIFEQSIIHSLRWLPDGSFNGNLQNVCGGGEQLLEKNSYIKSHDIYIATPLNGYEEKTALTPTLNKNDLLEFSAHKWGEILNKYECYF